MTSRLDDLGDVESIIITMHLGHTELHRITPNIQQEHHDSRSDINQNEKFTKEFQIFSET